MDIVELPIDQEPLFPPRCVRCGSENYRQTRMSTSTIGLWNFLLISGKSKQVSVPACRSCTKIMWVEQNLTLFFTLPLAISASIFITTAQFLPIWMRSGTPRLITALGIWAIASFVLDAIYHPTLDLIATKK